MLQSPPMILRRRSRSGVKPDRMSAIGFGEFRHRLSRPSGQVPVVDTASGQAGEFFSYLNGDARGGWLGGGIFTLTLNSGLDPSP